jgi:hypothetical protein
MMKTMEQLMDERHAAYQLALADGFRTEATMTAWREANRQYVIARDAQDRCVNASPRIQARAA